MRTVHSLNRPASKPGFTLVEILVATAVTAMLLVGLSVALGNHFHGAEDLMTSGYSEQFRRATQLIDRDFRGLTRVEPLPIAQSDHGTLHAYFQTTARLEAVLDSQWAGVCYVGYWAQEQAEGGLQLWRSEGDLNQLDGVISWTPLLEDMSSIEWMCRSETDWIQWPVDEKTLEDKQLQAIRIEITKLPVNDSTTSDKKTLIFQPVTLQRRG